jgi:hypothetical protein
MLEFGVAGHEVGSAGHDQFRHARDRNLLVVLAKILDESRCAAHTCYRQARTRCILEG